MEPKGTVHKGSFKTIWNGKIILAPITYFFDSNMNELGYRVQGMEINETTKDRKWSDSFINKLVFF